MSLFICFAPLTGGAKNNGRQMTIGCIIQRTKDGKFLDPNIGVWSQIPTLSKLTERGRSGDQHSLPLRGTYILERLSNYEPWVDCPHIITYHEYDQDKKVVGMEVQRPTIIPGNS